MKPNYIEKIEEIIKGDKIDGGLVLLPDEVGEKRAELIELYHNLIKELIEKLPKEEDYKALDCYSQIEENAFFDGVRLTLHKVKSLLKRYL